MNVDFEYELLINGLPAAEIECRVQVSVRESGEIEVGPVMFHELGSGFATDSRYHRLTGPLWVEVWACLSMDSRMRQRIEECGREQYARAWLPAAEYVRAA